MPKFNDLIQKGVTQGYSDIHITGSHPLVMRKNGAIIFDRENVWSHEDVDKVAANILSREQLETLQRRFSVDVARSINQVRVRINIFVTTRGLSLAVRLLPGKVPDLEGLNLHPCVQEFCGLTEGLILLAGSSGAGKSTTLAGMIEEINRTRSAHVITLEDPIEYRFLSRRCFIEQRELGTHFRSFEEGLRDVLREDPDVILVGELREPETMRLTIDAAEAGHLILASMHASAVVDAFYRIGNAFPPESQDVIRARLASTLRVLMLQKLVHIPKAGFRVPLLSIARGTQSIRAILRDNRLSQLEGVLQTGRDDGHITSESYRREFLDTRSQFASPSLHFRPSTEASQEVPHRSPLLEARSAAKPEASAGDFREVPSVPPGLSRRSPDGTLVLDDAESYEELINKMNQRAA